MSGPVTRYRLEARYIKTWEYLGGMAEDANGDYVRAEDYNRVRALLLEAREDISEWVHAYDPGASTTELLQRIDQELGK